MNRLISKEKWEYISKLSEIRSKYCCFEDDEEPYYRALSEGIKALKAIPSAEPKEVYYSGDGYADGEMVYDIANCPNCDYEFEESDFIWKCNFCPQCGQALEWEVDNIEEED